MKSCDIMEAVTVSVEEKIFKEWRHEGFIGGFTSNYLNMEIDGEEYVLVLHKVPNGHHYSEFTGEAMKMARAIKQGQHIFIAFQDGEAVLDSQLRPRMYKSREQFEKSLPAWRDGKAELVEYAPTLTPPNKPTYPCDLCVYNPPSSLDGKPCTYCPATGRPPEGEEET